VISGNVDYWQDEGFKTACTELGLPFVALVKEHPLSQAAARGLEDLYESTKYQYRGKIALVAGEATKRVLVSKGVCSKENTIVTGLPRFDAWNPGVVDMNHQAGTWVTLLSFRSGYDADTTFLEVLDDFVCSAKDAEARSSPLTFVIKAKNIEDEVEIRRLIGPEAIQHLRIVTHIPLAELFSRSIFVVGWGSMSLIEACGSKKHLVIPDWGECSHPDTSFLTKQTHQAPFATFPRSQSELRHVLADYIKTPPPAISREEAQEIVRQFVHLPFGQTVCNVIEKVMVDISKSKERGF
jgi:hypothetical protein